MNDDDIKINWDDLNEQTIREYFCNGYFDLIQFTFIFNRIVLSKDLLRELIGHLNHCQLLEFHSDILTAAKIVRVLSKAFLANAITFLKYCKVDFWRDQFQQFNALQKFRYRLEYQHTDEYAQLHRKEK